MQKSIIPAERIGQQIYLIRGQKVILDFDIARLYQVETRALVQAVKRNRARFPADFMFQLNRQEYNRSQFVIGSQKHRDPRYFPYAFTEHGIAMLSAVLKSERAVQMSILIVRAFVRLCEMLATNKELAARVSKLEEDQRGHSSVIKILVEEIKKLKKQPMIIEKKKTTIGFTISKR